MVQYIAKKNAVKRQIVSCGGGLRNYGEPADTPGGLFAEKTGLFVGATFPRLRFRAPRRANHT